MEVFFSAETTSGGLGMVHTYIGWVAVLEALAAKSVFVVCVHFIDVAPWVVEVPHEVVWGIHAGEEGGWFRGEGCEYGCPGFVFFSVSRFPVSEEIDFAGVDVSVYYVLGSNTGEDSVLVVLDRGVGSAGW